MLFLYIKKEINLYVMYLLSQRANFNVVSIYKKEIKFYGMYDLSNEALQGHLEALYEPQIVSVGSRQGGLKKVS